MQIQMSGLQKIKRIKDLKNKTKNKKNLHL